MVLTSPGTGVGRVVLLLHLSLYGALAWQPAALEGQTVSSTEGRSGAPGWLGIQISETVAVTTDGRDGSFGVDRSQAAVTIEDISPGSAAQEAGIRRGDVLLQINGVPATSEAVAALSARLRAGEVVTMILQRGERRLTVRPVARERPVAMEFPEQGETWVIRTDSLLDVHFKGWEQREPSGPLAPLLLGQSAVAGAKLTPMDPDLASYFQVTEGLLVIEVVPNSPAGEAGFRGGDVIVEVEGTPIRNITALRAALARASGEATVTLVRDGRTMSLPLR